MAVLWMGWEVVEVGERKIKKRECAEGCQVRPQRFPSLEIKITLADTCVQHCLLPPLGSSAPRSVLGYEYADAPTDGLCHSTLQLVTRL